MTQSSLSSSSFKNTPIARRRRVTLRACDLCRKRKVKCDRRERMREAQIDLRLDDDGSAMDVPCSNCLASSKKCSYGKDPPPRTIPKGYVDYMEDRQERLAKILARLSPYTDYSDEIGSIVPPSAWKDDGFNPQNNFHGARMRRTEDGPLPLRPHHARDPQRLSPLAHQPGDSSLKLDIKRLPTLPIATAVKMKRNKSIEFQECHPDDGDQDDAVLTSSDEEYGNAMSPRLGDIIDECTLCHSFSLPGTRFHGKSSSIRIARAALRIRRKSQKGIIDDESEETQRGRPQEKSKSAAAIATPPIHAHSISWPPFPPRGLLETLINLYFCKSNIIWPLLHRPTFDADVLRQRHKRDLGFACVVLGVCAVGSRYCTDNRVLAKIRRKDGKERGSTPSWSTNPWDGPDPWIDDLEQDLKDEGPAYEDACEGSVGWKYYDRMQYCYAAMTMTPVTLTELQTAFLMQQFLRGMPGVSAGWVMTGAAIRKAQDRGAHRQKVYSRSLEDELWKRAFWCLVVADRFGSAVFGRSCLSRDEDMDVELPVEIDDEFFCASRELENLSTLPEQPTGQPSQIVAFSLFLKLSVIYVWSLRTLYTIGEKKAHLGLSGEGWEQDVVRKLNGALDEWAASVPPHLMWDPKETNPIWRTQSASLFLVYHVLQIQIYQCFVQGAKLSGTPSSVSLGGTRRVSGLPADRFSSAVSQSFPAVAICAHAARSNARILKGLLSHVRPGEKAWAELSDIPTLVVAAFLSGSTIRSVRVANGLTAVSGATKAHQTKPMDDGEEEFDVCLDLLRVVKDRWPRADVALNLMSTAAMRHEPSTSTPAASSTPTSPATSTLSQDVNLPPVYPNDTPALLNQEWRMHDSPLLLHPPTHLRAAENRYEPHPGNGRAAIEMSSLRHSYNVPPVAQHLTAVIPMSSIPRRYDPAAHPGSYPEGADPTTNHVSTPSVASFLRVDPVSPLQTRPFSHQNPATAYLYDRHHYAGAPPEEINATASASQAESHTHEGVTMSSQESILIPPPRPVFSTGFLQIPGGHSPHELLGRLDDAPSHQHSLSTRYTSRYSTGEEAAVEPLNHETP